MCFYRIIIFSSVMLLITACHSRSVAATGQGSAAMMPAQQSGCGATSDLCLNNCCPVGASSVDQVVNHEIFILDNNCSTKFADWVAYQVVESNIGKTERRVWRADPDLPKDCTLTPSNYDGAYAAANYDRGHQAPLASFTSNPDWENTNYLSNITPQKADLNRGAWLKLESAVRELAMQHSTVYVVTGPLYNDKVEMTPMPNAPEAKVPTDYYKVVAIKDMDHLEVAAFIMPQSAARSDDMCQYEVPLEKVQDESNLTIFPITHHEKTSLSKALGCN